MMVIKTLLTQQFMLRLPIIQAPLAGGGDTPNLVAAVSEAGALGFIGAAYLTPAQIGETARAVRLLTPRPFGINLFAPMPVPAPPRDPTSALASVTPFFAELGLPAPAVPAPPADGFDAQFSAALGSGAACFSFTFGTIGAGAVKAAKERGMFVIGTATTVEEAVALEQTGADAVVAQGGEAGGHRGSFIAHFDAGMIGTMALVPQMVDAIEVPVIASGGIMDGRGIVAALSLGASAVQMGTAFLTTVEAGVPEAYKEAILAAREHETRVTRAFSGRPARGIVNRFMTEVDSAAADAILPFPFQNMLTRPLRTAAARQGRAAFLSLWAGQGVGLARRRSAADLVAELGREIDLTLNRLTRG
jgi:nitronate monooxygenase